MASRTREEKVGLISPQKVKKRALDRTFRLTPERLESALPKYTRNAHVRLHSNIFALACIVNRWKCRFKLILLSEFVHNFFERMWYSCARYARSFLCLL